MARTQLASQSVPDSGLLASYTLANVDGHWVAPGCIIHVKNETDASVNITLVTGALFRGKAVVDTVVAVDTGADKFIGVGRSDLYAQPSGADEGRVYVDFSDTFSLGAAKALAAAVAGTVINTTLAHGLVAGNAVVFDTMVGGAGITAGTVVYYVRSAGLDADSFTIATSPGGSAVAFSTDIVSGNVKLASILKVAALEQS